MRNQLQAAQDERPHQNLAQLSIGLDQREQRLAVELNDLTWLAYAQAAECAAPRDHVGFARKLTGAMAHDERLATVGRTQRLDFAAEDDKHRHRFVADLDQHFASRRRAAPSVRRNSRELVFCEGRKDAIGSRDRDRERRQRDVRYVHRASHRRSLARRHSLGAE